MPDTVKEPSAARLAYWARMKGRKQSASHIAKRAAGMVRYYADPSNRAKQSAIVRKAVKAIPVEKRIASNKKRSESHKGMSKPWNTDPAKCRANSIKMLEDYASGNRQVALHIGKPCRYSKSIMMRSTWEVAFAHWLDKHKIVWEYEPKTFDLDTCSYRPDFYLVKSKVWIEIKGYLTEKAAAKITLFRTKYPRKRFYMLAKKELKDLGVLYGS